MFLMKFFIAINLDYFKNNYIFLTFLATLPQIFCFLIPMFKALLIQPINIHIRIDTFVPSPTKIQYYLCNSQSDYTLKKHKKSTIKNVQFLSSIFTFFHLHKKISVSSIIIRTYNHTLRM